MGGLQKAGPGLGMTYLPTGQKALQSQTIDVKIPAEKMRAMIEEQVNEIVASLQSQQEAFRACSAALMAIAAQIQQPGATVDDVREHLKVLVEHEEEIRLVLEPAPEEPAPLGLLAVCPECKAGKHGNCDGTAMSAADVLIDCQCPPDEHVVTT